MIENQNANLFYVGNNGNFDRIVEFTLKKLKPIYPTIDYATVLSKLPTDGKTHSDTVYPDGFENVPPKFAIIKRNRWMIDHADTVVTYVVHSFGGAAQFKNLAKTKGKRIIELTLL